MSTPAELQERIAELEMRNRCAETVIAISTAMACAHSPIDVLSTLVEPVCKQDMLPDTERGAVAASLIYVERDADGEAEGVQLCAIWSEDTLHPDLVPGLRLSLAQFPDARKRLLNANMPFFVEDVRSDSSLIDPVRDFFLTHDLHALIVMPLVRDDEWFGLLMVSWDRPHYFSEEERFVYSALPPLLSPTIEVHQLINDLEEKVAAHTTQVISFKLLADSLPVAISTLDANARFIYTNTAFNELFGFTKEPLGLALGSLLGDDEAANLAASIQSADDFSGAVTYRRQNGQFFTGQTTTFLATSSTNTPTYQTLTIEDVTDRLRDEEALKQSYKHLQAILEHMPAVVYLKDMAGRFIVANHEFYKRTNKTPQTLLGKTSQEAFPDLHYDALWEPHEQQVIDTGEAVYVEHVSQTTGKTYFAAKFLLYDETGNPYAFCNTSIDITKRIEAEKAAHQTQRQFQDMFDHTPAIVFIKDLQGRHLMVNQGWREYTGLYDDKETIGKTPYQIYPHVTDPEERFSDNEKVVLTTGRAVIFEEFSERTGKTVLSTKFPLWDAAGEMYAICNSSIDITERKHIEEQIQTTRQQLQDMFDNTPAVVFAKDLEGRYIFVNRQWRERSGLNEEAAIGKQASKLFPSSDYIDGKLLANEIAVLESQEAVTFEETGMFTKRDYLTTLFPIYDAASKPYALCSIAIDTTEQKRIEEQVQTTRRQLQDMFDNIPAFVYAKDLEGRFIFANSIWCDRAGVAHQDVIGKLELDLIPEQRIVDGVWRANELAVLEAQQPLIFEEMGVRTGCVYLTTLFPLRDDSGTIYALCSSSLDITDRKQAEAEREELMAHVWEQAERVAHIISTVPEGVVLMDTHYQVILANPLATEDLKQSEGVVVGDVLRSFGDQPLDVLLTSPTDGLWHEVTLTTENATRYLEVIARPIETSPANTGWVLVWHDVTRERAIQKQIQQQERLAAVGQLAAGIAHDFNNIVAVIVLYAQIVRQTANLPPKAHDRLQVISEQAHRASDLIDQILDFSRRSVMERKPLDMTPFLKELVKLLARTMPENIIIDLQITPNNHTVNADPTRIQQTIMNLVVNARDAMPNGGDLHITLDRAIITANNAPLPDMAAGQWVQITVTDTGAGIPAEALSHIFEPFFTTKEFGEGTGLGLAQVHGIIHQHDGYITVQTEQGVGTTFTIYLPSLVQQTEFVLLDSETLTHGNGELILLVEDNAATREALVASLEILNYEVITAADGRQALALWQNNRRSIRLVISDVVMPNMGGVALFYALREYDPTVRVLLLTGHVMEKNMEEQLGDLKAHGLLNWLQKPADLPLLAQAIGQALH